MLGFDGGTSVSRICFWHSAITDLFRDTSACGKCSTGGTELLGLICKCLFLHYRKI